MSTSTATHNRTEGPISVDNATAAVHAYTVDIPSRRTTAWSVLATVVASFILTLGAWLVLRQTNLAAYNTSMVTKGIATAGTVIILVAVGVVLWRWLMDEHTANDAYRLALKKAEDPQLVSPVAPPRPRWRVFLTHAICYLAPAGLTVTTLGIPLSATKLYLDGVQVDQVFRTQFLTRMETTWANQDMNYWDMPSYYPLGWFWLGGRLANLLGLSGWEAYQPWAITSIAVAGAVLVPVWQRIVGSLPVATAIALVTVCVAIIMSGEEPYGAIVAMFIPALTVLIRRALLGSWWATAAMAITLGISASFYTLFTGVIALTVVAIAAIFAALLLRRWLPIKHLLVIGLGAIAIALITWGPYLLKVLQGHPTESAAQRYLPPEGTELPIPFLSPSVLGLLCLFGVIYLIVRATDWDVRMMGIATIAFYLWALLSMVFAIAGTTLLGFRVDVLIVLQLATAGVLALAEIRLLGPHKLYPNAINATQSRQITTVALVLMLMAGAHYAQDIPRRLETAIDHAYQDTDGNGERADQFPPDVARYYGAIDAEIQSHGWVPEDTVVVTDENRFLAFNPYHGFNAFTAHYANPLGQFSVRNDTMRGWADQSWRNLSEPEAFIDALDNADWRGPDVFIFRGTLENSESWKVHISEDIFPNQPNVRYIGLLFNPNAFHDESLWHLTEIGPFVVATRTKE